MVRIMAVPDRRDALDHVVVLMFENRSFDNLLGRLYEPGEVSSFEGVIGKDLSNPIPEWAEDGAKRATVPYGVAANMDTPNPDPGEEYQPVNTQLFGIIDPPENRGVLAERMAAPYNQPADGRGPTMDGFVADYISALWAETGRQPTHEEYAQIMTGYNTLLMIVFDEHGGTYDHVPPPAAIPPEPSAPAGQMGFRFDRLRDRRRPERGSGRNPCPRDPAARRGGPDGRSILHRHLLRRTAQAVHQGRMVRDHRGADGRGVGGLRRGGDGRLAGRADLVRRRVHVPHPRPLPRLGGAPGQGAVRSTRARRRQAVAGPQARWQV
jgi:Phosphoesterase family